MEEGAWVEGQGEAVMVFGTGFSSFFEKGACWWWCSLGFLGVVAHFFDKAFLTLGFFRRIIRDSVCWIFLRKDEGRVSNPSIN